MVSDEEMGREFVSSIARMDQSREEVWAKIEEEFHADPDGLIEAMRAIEDELNNSQGHTPRNGVMILGIIEVRSRLAQVGNKLIDGEAI